MFVDAEFTSAIFGGAGEIRVVAMRRSLHGNMTTDMRVERDPTIEDLLVRLAKELRLDGFLNVQMRLSDDGPMIFEINPRFSSTVMMRHLIGYRDLVWSIEAWDHLPLSDYSPPREGSQVFRMSREIETGHRA